MNDPKSQELLIQKPNEATEAECEEAILYLMSSPVDIRDFPTVPVLKARMARRKEAERKMAVERQKNRLTYWLEMMATEDPAILFPPKDCHH